MTRTGFSKTFYGLVALGSFAVAGLMFVSLSQWQWEGAGSPHSTTVSEHAVRNDPPVATAPAPGTAKQESSPPRSLAIPKVAAPAPRLDSRALERQRALRQPATEEGTLSHVRYWINANLAFDAISDSTKRTISVIFSGIGMIFTIRTFLLTRRRHQMLEAHLLGGNNGETPGG